MNEEKTIARVSDEELERQRAFMRAVRKLNYRPQRYHIVTLGCQMNVRDSETLAGMLEEMGYARAETREAADLILYNTCCVRENAENRALGNVIWLKELKKLKPRLLICACGCMMQEAGMAQKLVESYPFIDLVFGTHNLYRFPELLHARLCEEKQVFEVLDTPGNLCEGLPERRGSAFMAYLTIMYGCNNFCSYCIVPYVRGRERSRRMEDILDEAKRLVDGGAQEIMLLGQNVNSYRDGDTDFAELLFRVNELGVPRLRFMTSHPKDLSDELIGCFGSLEHLAGHLHLPVQSGSDEILRRMNRRYDREHYLSLIQKLRAAAPDIGLTTDLIVGFPGETEADFSDTMDLVARARYDAAFTFIYSPRAGTAAASMPDPTPMEEKTERIQRLIDLQQKIGGEKLLEQIGRVEQVLVEGVSARDPGSVCGKTQRSLMVNFPGDASLIGRFRKVRILSAGRNTLRGEAIETR